MLTLFTHVYYTFTRGFISDLTLAYRSLKSHAGVGAYLTAALEGDTDAVEKYIE
jgi:hypothetical protein